MRKGGGVGFGVGGAASGICAAVGVGALSGWVVKATPLPRPPNGPLMSSATCTFGPERRASSAGLRRGKISPSGRLIILLSSSPPELAKIPGASWRSSPKVILTAPNASCVVTVSTGRLMVMPGGGTVMVFPRKSMGRLVMMGASGTAISFAFGGGFAARNGGGADTVAVGAALATGAPAATGRAAGA